MSADVPLVSVIVPVRDDHERLALCLDALARQTYPAARLEVLVVDNGSTDDVAPVCAGRPGVTLLRHPQGGSYAARNAGIAAARGTVLAFTDSDCQPADTWLERAVAALRSRPDTGFVGGRIDVFFRDPGRPTPAEIYDRLIRFPQDVDVGRNGRSVTANVVTWRHVVDRVGPFQGRLESGGDLEFTRRVSDAGFAAVYAHDAVVRHPARRTLAELIAKQRRLARGQFALVTDLGGGAVLPGRLRPLFQKYSTFLWSESGAILRSPRDPSRRRRWIALAVNLLVRLAGLQMVVALTVRRSLRPDTERSSP